MNVVEKTEMVEFCVKFSRNLYNKSEELLRMIDDLDITNISKNPKENSLSIVLEGQFLDFMKIYEDFIFKNSNFDKVEFNKKPKENDFITLSFKMEHV